MEKEFNWRTPVIAIDFDGCLCRDNFPEVGAPNWEIINEAKRVQKNGACLILWTCREGELLKAAVDACQGWGLEFDAVNENAPHRINQFGNACRKIGADEYWDDRAVYMAGSSKWYRDICGDSATLRNREQILKFMNEGMRPEIEVLRSFKYDRNPEFTPRHYFESLANLLQEALEQMVRMMATLDESGGWSNRNGGGLNDNR